MSRYYGLILAGGRGTRFWPRSRRRSSKQVLNVVGDRSLIQATVDRLRPLVPPERIWILTNDFLRDEIVRQLPEVPAGQILAEPAQRNTAPAINLAAHILHSIDPEAVMGVFPSDHVISGAARYLELAEAAYREAERGAVTVLGIHPRWPETGYGYIEFPPDVRMGSLEASPVRRFREKPDEATAEKYVEAGHFYWNAGMFFWRADVILDEMRRHMPQTAGLIGSLPGFRDPDFPARLAETFPTTENISIDYAVLERSAKVTGIACDEIGWSDLGSWNAVWELLSRDGAGNCAPVGDVLYQSSGNYVSAPGKTVALVGVRDLVVVETPDALLIADRKQAQKVGDVVKLLEEQGREDLL
jgi:mannose-1-phosphate guanylyltransferase